MVIAESLAYLRKCQQHIEGNVILMPFPIFVEPKGQETDQAKIEKNIVSVLILRVSLDLKLSCSPAFLRRNKIYLIIML